MRGTPATDLAASYGACRRLHRRRDPTFYAATLRLPRDLRPATHALYAYVRRADDIVDAPAGDATPSERRRALSAWEDALARARAGEPASHPFVGALADAERRHVLPLDELGRYMRSMRIDCGPVRIGSWDALVDYMEGSAGSVGRIMTPLLGAPEAAGPHFGRLGLAFQLTNFIRDVREDRALDRVYLPATDLDRFGVGAEDLLARSASPAVRRVVALQVARARDLFAAAEPAAVAAVAPSVRPGIRLACAVYRRVLARVDEIGGDVLGRRTLPPPWAIAPAAARALRADGGGGTGTFRT